MVLITPMICRAGSCSYEAKNSFTKAILYKLTPNEFTTCLDLGVSIGSTDPLIALLKMVTCWKKILVGRLKKPKEIYNNNEILLMEGVCSLKMRYIGDNLVLLTAMDREDIVDVIKKPEEWLTDLFEIIGPWDAKATPANRLTWLRISGEQGVL
ncbi:hypothetical protein JHK86_024485 [Glycine max]|nr:hypothetical protein JHK86_024485 [Glycine max]